MYQPVPKVPDFPALERRILETWNETRAFAKLRAKNAGGKPWSFLDGPITANNPMGIHHAWGRGLKDMFQRYYAMNGRELRYQNGFDCQGLWVEVEVEKELGFTKKTDVLDYGIDRFVRDCKERVLRFAVRITEQSIRLGCWMEWDDPATLDALRQALHDRDRELRVTLPTGHEARAPAEQIVARLGCAEYGGSYFTFSDENNDMIWAFLKKCHEEGFLYHGDDVVPWCCRCGTGLSQMEVAEGRKRVTHTSVFVRFPLRDRPGEALLVWTTTPWGLALPIWVCGDCHEFTVVGSREELGERAVEGWDAFAGHSPHRPWIDAVTIRCPSCGALARRIPDVGNPWLDAGIVPFSTMHFQRHPEIWEKWFPADLVIECFPGQFRNWFYALLAMSAMMDGRAPFQALLGHGLVRDARAQEMHKSLGNAIDFDRCAETLGVELVRYIFARQNPAHNVNFPDVDGGVGSDTELANTVRRRLLTLWNLYSFFITYAEIDAWRPGVRPVDADELAELDRWILSRLQGLVAAAHQAFGELAPHRLVLGFEQFTDDLSNWYIRRSRRRFWKAGSDRDKEAAFQTLHAVLATLIRVMAPILPFLTEEMYQNLVRAVDPEAPESIHLTDYPEVDAARIDQALERKIECVIRTRNLGLGLRSRSGIKIRQPLARLLVRASDEAARAALAEEHFARQVREECNVKALELIDDEKALVTTRVKANRRSLGRRYGKLLPAIEARLVALDGAALRDSLEREETLSLEVDGTAVEVTAQDVELVDEAPEHLVTISAPGFFAALDIAVTEELEAEGIARDLNRHAQDQRRRVGLEIADRITVAYVGSDRIAAALADHQDYLRTELLAERIDRVRCVDQGRVVKVGGEEVELAVSRVSAAAS